MSCFNTYCYSSNLFSHIPFDKMQIKLSSDSNKFSRKSKITPTCVLINPEDCQRYNAQVDHIGHRERSLRLETGTPFLRSHPSHVKYLLSQEANVSGDQLGIWWKNTWTPLRNALQVTGQLANSKPFEGVLNFGIFKKWKENFHPRLKNVHVTRERKATEFRERNKSFLIVYQGQRYLIEFSPCTPFYFFWVRCQHLAC